MKAIIWLIIILVIIAGAGYFLLPTEPTGEVPNPSASEEPARYASADAALVGVWQSTDDALYSREFATDGTVTERYEGDESATIVGTWETFTDTSNLPEPLAGSAGVTFLRVVFEGEAFYYSIADVSLSNLQLIYLDRGGALNFIRVE